MSAVVITVPCFNEARRFSVDEFRRFLADPRVGLLFVDDGSTDDTLTVLRAFAAEAPERIEVVSLDRNQGKSEAVRTGLLRSLDAGASIVGFTDADLSTPVDEVLRLVEVIATTEAAAVLGSRVAHLGADIRRSQLRRYLGRAFSTLGSMILRQRIYDTQCGAKLFRASEGLRAALAEEFRSRWAFDVELLGRTILASGSEPGFHMVEVPLRRWTDVPGSKMGLASMVRAGFDLCGVAIDLERRRRS